MLDLDEIFLIVAKKHRLPVEQIRLAYKSFTDGIRFYIKNPLLSKSVIKIPLFGRFKITERSIKSYYMKELVPQLEDIRQQFKRKKSNASNKNKQEELG